MGVEGGYFELGNQNEESIKGSSPILVGKNAIRLPIASRFFKAWANKSIKNRRSEDRNPPTTSTEYTSLSSRLFLGRLLLSRRTPLRGEMFTKELAFGSSSLGAEPTSASPDIGIMLP